MTKFIEYGNFLINIENITTIGKIEDNTIKISLNMQYVDTTYPDKQERDARFEELKKMLCGEQQ